MSRFIGQVPFYTGSDLVFLPIPPVDGTASSYPYWWQTVRGINDTDVMTSPPAFYDNYYPIYNSNSEMGFDMWPESMEGGNFALWELCFWFHRVHTWHVDLDYTFTHVTDTDTTTLTATDSMDVQATSSAEFFSSPIDEVHCFAGAPIFSQTQDFELTPGHSVTWGIRVSTSLITISGISVKPKDWSLCPIVHVEVGSNTTRFGPINKPDGTPLFSPVAGGSVRFQGHDAIMNKDYDRHFAFYYANDLLAPGDTEVANVTITPLDFWPYNDAEGVPLYSTTDGHQI